MNKIKKGLDMALLIMILIWLAVGNFFAIGMAVIIGANIWAAFFALATFGCVRALFALRHVGNA
tara:strand:+ start:111 stop:302 length:192 start_codon:yes stop_codon:yes gene_type:complete